MLEIVICEDNEKSLKEYMRIIEKAISRNSMNARIVCTAGNPSAVEEYVKHNSANVFFLDIDLKAYDTGYTLAQKIRKNNRRAYIVFLTGHLEYVLHAFKVKAFDFLPKPISDEALEQCLLDVWEDCNAGVNTGGSDEEYIEIKSGPNFYRIKTKHIIYIEKIKNKAVIHMANTSITCFEALSILERHLDKNSFIRCHKSFIVNRAYIARADMNNNEIVFETGQVCYIGRTFKKSVQSILSPET